MRIGIDSRPLRERQTSGIPMYVRSLLKGIAALDKTNEYILYAHKDFDFPLPGPNFRKRSGALTRYGSVWMQTELPAWVDRDNVDVFWGTQHILPIRMPKRIKAVLTVCDLVHLVFPETMKRLNFLINKYLIPPSVNRTDAIVTISDWTMKDVVKYLHPQNKIMEVTYLGVGDHMYPRDPEKSKRSVAQKFGVAGPFILTVGTFEPRKNINGLFKAFSLIADKIPHSIVIVGQKGWKNKEIIDEVKRSNIQHRVRLLGYVADGDLPELYSAAELFVFPSLYEGFGLPPLEAMTCGVPVVASNISSLPEVVGDAAVLVNPYDPSTIADGIMRIVTNPASRADYIKRGFDQASKFKWEKTAQQMVDVFSRAYNKK